MCRLPNGNTLVIVWELMPEQLAKRIKGGFSPEQMERITGDGNFMSFLLQGVGVGGRQPVHIWHAYEHFDPEVDTLCTVDFPAEWTHLNAVELTPEGDILISSQKLDTVLKISWPKGEVLWRWGGLGCMSHQHDPTITPDGTLLVFDNGTHHPLQGRSRVVEVDIQTGEIIWQYIGSPVFSMLSLHIAGAERLTNGNTWEWNSPFVHDFKGIKAVMLFRAHRYSADGPELRGKKIDDTEFEEFNEKWGLNPKA
jgi:hypothetical protein